jgi:hypothetical protein
VKQLVVSLNTVKSHVHHLCGNLGLLFGLLGLVAHTESKFNQLSGCRWFIAQGTRIIFSSEMDFDFDPQVAHTDALRALAAETGASLYLNYVVHDKTGFRNETILLSLSGQFSEVYGKHHNTIGEPPIVSAGTFPVLVTPFGRIASILCMDGVFTDAHGCILQKSSTSFNIQSMIGI